nr:cysteine-rich receptor-like protein kinase 10 [Solanum lycopersicum]
MAYTNVSGSKCVVWLEDLVDMRYSQIAGNNIFIWMANGKPDAPVAGWRWKEEWTVFASLISELALLTILLIAVGVLCRTKRNVLDESEINQPANSQETLLQGTNVIAYDSNDLAAATNNFSLANKIGHGGFGNVYKGVLANGVEIAVKKQDMTSRQGFSEFKNEVKLIAKLQHRNLTKLLGYCINGAEKFLVYEFMANNSLDKVIFDPARRGAITWPMRFNIIKGIAKGLVYMHHDSRLTIIHRDLKASNVLLDREMTPKISDLGLSRVVEDGVEEKTQHLIGTRGYMPPEYMKHGRYSTKSDVFSFGILTLEIVSGQKNYDYRHPVYDIGLVDYAWRIWSNGNAIELLDPMIEKPGDENEVLGCILVGLLCCQRGPQDRPSMIQVVSLLEENEMSRLNFVPQELYYSKDSRRMGNFSRRQQCSGRKFGMVQEWKQHE